MNSRPHPIAGKDYPRTYQEFLEWFNDEVHIPAEAGRRFRFIPNSDSDPFRTMIPEHSGR